MCKVVAYYRVSTEGQGRSGLGLEAQREAVGSLCRNRGWNIVAEFTEVESGKRDDRPELERAMHRAKVTGGVLVIAKLDRLSRSAAMITRLQEEGTRFIAANMPEACELTVGMLAVVAREERKAISERTKAALAAAKARGAKLGNPNGAAAIRRAAKGNGAAVSSLQAGARERATDLAPIIADIQRGPRPSQLSQRS
jgi:DNA invertase Pin-like site-specific DNA recombinase